MMIGLLSWPRNKTVGNLHIMQCFVMLKLIVLVACIVPGAVSYNKTLYAAVVAETRLLKDLFEGYDSRARPVTKVDETIHASFGISFQSLLQLRETEEVMESISFMLTAWHDGRLTWNKSHYMGIDSIKIPAQEIWRPDIVSYTSVDEEMHLGETFAQVLASGHVYWNPTMFLRSPCKVNLRTFPFDKQTCSMVFASTMYHGNQLNLTYWGGKQDTALDVSDYSNTGWEMVSHSVNIKVAKTSCCHEPYPHMKVSLEFRRNPHFYVHMFVVPSLLLGILVPVSLLMPPDSKERVTIGSFIILSVVLLEAKLCDMLPMGHFELPAISIYYTVTLLWSVLSLMCSIMVLNLHNRGTRTSKVPDSIRWIFLRSLRRLVCLSSESYYPLSDTEFINMRGLDKPGSHGQDRLASVPLTQNESRLGSSPSSKLEKDVEELSRQIQTMSSRFSKQENHQEIVAEWRQLALVIDRILFLLFLLMFLVCSVFLLA